MNESGTSKPQDYPLAQSDATRMLATGLERVRAETGATQRDIAMELNYRTSVVLSHMALGRVPIPIDRAQEIARVLGLDPTRFLLATLKQRHREVDFEALFGVRVPQESAVAAELEAIAGVELDELPKGTREILRQVVSSKLPERRWLSAAELPIIEMLRRRLPTLHGEGLTPDDSRRLATLVERNFTASG